MGPPATSIPREVLVVTVLAAVILGVRFGHQYLWQDEAATAILGERLFEFGRPLAYDGRNLITMDYDRPGDEARLAESATSAEAGVGFFADRRDFKADTTWTGHPWGQFVLAGLSLKTLGHGTWQARLPFVLCGVLTAGLLYSFTAKRFGRLVAVVALALLLTNVYWILHMRQCRYYALSSLGLLATFVAYWRWQEGCRWGRTGLLCTGWLLFQSDFGTFFPVAGVLAIESLWRARRPRGESVLLFAALGVLVTPWIWYYELADRYKESQADFGELLQGHLHNLNLYLIPIPLLAAALLAAWALRRKSSGPADRRMTGVTHREEFASGQSRARAIHRADIITLAGALLVALTAWMTVVTPVYFVRYLISAAPEAALVSAWMIVLAADWLLPSSPRAASAVTAVVAVLIAVTPWLSVPGDMLIAPTKQPWQGSELAIRPEWKRLAFDYLGRLPDPNRDVVESLADHLRPQDEILINYEDGPLLFYTPCRIRGGYAAFRVRDASAPPARFAVGRNKAGGAASRIVAAEIQRHPYRILPFPTPAIGWSHSPDPLTDPLDESASRGQMFIGVLDDPSAK